MSEILIYGDIGWEIRAADIVREVADADPGGLTVRVDSCGGDAYQGFSIMNALRRYDGDVTVYVDGLAASAASVIAVGGGDRVVMAPGSQMMVHDAWIMAEGNADELTQQAENLTKTSDSIAEVYAEKAGGTVEEWREIMAANTFYTADEAVEVGLADAVDDSRHPVSAKHRARVMARARERFGFRTPNENVPQSGVKEEKMSFIDKLATSLGMKPEQVAHEISHIRAEDVETSGTVTITYPEDVTVAPTETVTVEPEIVDADSGVGSTPAGIDFELGTTPEGFEVTLDEETGAVTITAPAGAEPGDTAEITVIANGQNVTIAVTVRSLSDADEETPDEPVTPPESVTLDRVTYDKLRAMAAKGEEAYTAAEAKAREDEVDQWIDEGRIAAAARETALAFMNSSPAEARKFYTAMPKNTINRAEHGYAKHERPDTDGMSRDDRVAALIKRANELASNH